MKKTRATLFQSKVNEINESTIWGNWSIMDRLAVDWLGLSYLIKSVYYECTNEGDNYYSRLPYLRRYANFYKSVTILAPYLGRGTPVTKSHLVLWNNMITAS